MSTLSVRQIDSLVRGQGITGEREYWADAIALAESGGDQYAYNPETAAGTPQGAGSYGLWQIYSYAHPEYTRALLWSSPAYNASAMAQISSNGANFTPWTTYNSGAAGNYLPAVESQLGVGMTPSLATPAGVLPATAAGSISPPINPLDVGGWGKWLSGISQGAAAGLSKSGNPVADILNGIWQTVLATAGPVLEKIGFFTLALIIIVIGVVLVAWEPIKDTAQTAIKVAA